MSGHGKRHGILIVDDQPAALQVLERTLGRDEYHLVSASSSDDAVRVAAKERPDLVILDVNVPGTGGLEICRALKANSDTEEIPVILLGAVADTGVRVEGLGVGAVDFIQKPFEPSELRARVVAHLRLKERLDALRTQFVELSRRVEEEGRRSGSVVDPGVVDQGCVESETKTIRFRTGVARVQGVVNQLLVGIAGRLSPKLRNDLALGIHEMVLNAIEHGNLGITSEAKSAALESQTFGELIENRMAVPELAARTITVAYEFDGEKVAYRITDEGDGFDWSRFLARDEPEDLLASNGRGILISRFIFDAIRYNEAGNEVYLEKRIG
jgi:DNA-binding response OmpR family regulator